MGRKETAFTQQTDVPLKCSRRASTMHLADPGAANPGNCYSVCSLQLDHATTSTIGTIWPARARDSTTMCS